MGGLVAWQDITKYFIRDGIRILMSTSYARKKHMQLEPFAGTE